MPADKKFWKHVDKMAKIVEKWPKWKRGGEEEGKMIDRDETTEFLNYMEDWSQHHPGKPEYFLGIAREIVKEKESLRRENLALALQNKDMREVLEKVRDLSGGICPEFRTCEHEECRSNGARYMIAEEALALPDLSTEIVDRFEKRVEAKVWNFARMGARQFIPDGTAKEVKDAIARWLDMKAKVSDQEAGG